MIANEIRSLKVYMKLTVLSREAVAKISPSADHAQSQMMRPCDLSAAIGSYPTTGY